MADTNQQADILAACSQGNIPTLRSFFESLGSGPDHPLETADADAPLTSSADSPSAASLLVAAVKARQTATLRFVHSCLSNCSLSDGPVGAAIDAQDVELIRIVCTLDPAAARGRVGHVNVLAYACSQTQNPAVVAALLDAGADPNQPPAHTPPYSDVSYAVSNGLPVATIERFFDAGYAFDDGWAVRWAVQYDRPDVLEFLFARGKDLPTARIPPLDELIQMAEDKSNRDMVVLIRKVYPKKKDKGLMAGLIGRFRSRSRS